MTDADHKIDWEIEIARSWDWEIKISRSRDWGHEIDNVRFRTRDQEIEMKLTNHERSTDQDHEIEEKLRLRLQDHEIEKSRHWEIWR